MIGPCMGERWLVRSLLERERRSAVDSMSEAQQHELAQRDAALREAEYARAIAEERMANLATHSKAAASYQSLCHQLDVATARSHELERSMRVHTITPTITTAAAAATTTTAVATPGNTTNNDNCNNTSNTFGLFTHAQRPHRLLCRRLCALPSYIVCMACGVFGLSVCIVYKQ